MPDFTPKHLTAEHLQRFYEHHLQEAELQVLNAWVQVRLDSGDEVRQKAYEVALEALHRLEDDCARVIGPPMEVPAESPVNAPVN